MGVQVCLKVISNNKDFFDQSLDEIKLLTTIKNASGDDLDKYNLLRIFGKSLSSTLEEPSS